MCDLTELELYGLQWQDYFDYVNTDVRNLFSFEDDLYIGYGSKYNLPIEDVKFWYEDAETYFVSSIDPVEYIENKYQVTDAETIDYFVEKEIDEGMLFESNGYWFYA